ncbi:hypothetical protein N338_07188, partial [Podiceps cristatus]
QLEAGLHTHLCFPALPKAKSGCTCIYRMAGMKKKSSFLLPIFLAFSLLHLLLAEVGGDDVLSPSEMRGKGSARLPSSLALQRCSERLARGLLPPSCWKIKEILFCFGMNPRGFEVLGGLCCPGKAFSP